MLVSPSISHTIPCLSDSTIIIKLLNSTAHIRLKGVLKVVFMEGTTILKPKGLQVNPYLELHLERV